MENVAGTWSSVSLSHGFEHGLVLTARGEYRSTNNLSATDVFFFRLTGSYKPCPYFSTAITYDLLFSKKTGAVRDGIALAPYLQPHHRMLYDLSGMYQKNGFSFLLRERYVLARVCAMDLAGCDAEGMYQTYHQSAGYTHTLRSMPQLTYQIGDTRWAPFVAVELYNDLAPGAGFKLQQYHLFAGTNVKLDDRNSLRLFYVMQHKVPNDKIVHTIGVDYFVKI